MLVASTLLDDSDDMVVVVVVVVELWVVTVKPGRIFSFQKAARVGESARAYA